MKTLSSITAQNNTVLFAPLDESDIAFVVRLCMQAGTLAQEMRDTATIETKSHAQDFVTSADWALSRLIVDGLSARFPEHVVLSEEEPWDATVTDKPRWMVDPIDGTKYYIDGSGNYSIMVGLVKDNRPVFGCFYIPAKKQALVGGPGMGAAIFRDCDGTLTRVDVDLPSGIQSSTLRAVMSKNELKIWPCLADLPDLQIVECTSIGLDIVELVEGRADIFVKLRPVLKYWDTAATVAVAFGLGMEAGTEVLDAISYSFASPVHDHHVLIGRKDLLARWREIFSKIGRETVIAASS
jgi:3'-phosphoadenosine 5'-phosphosulfate (PAPS) 3'-phosphatase